MKRKICVITGSRADYGLLRWVMQGIKDAPDLELQVVATGMHISTKFNSTFHEIEKDGFNIDAMVDLQLNSDTSVGVSKSMGLGVIGFGETLAELKPDLVVLLGDRFEIFAAAAAASVARIPIAHLHGGETTEGAVDEAFRHSITKMSHLHFVAAEEYRRRVIQLGEHPDRVFLVGGLGVDGIKRMQLLDRSALEASLDFKLGPRNLLVTFHPVTLEHDTSAMQMRELLAALASLKDTHLIFTMPNSDPGGRVLFDLIQEFTESHVNARAYTSLGQLGYLSCLKQVDGVIGNSSSGLTEAPSFGKGTINIGDRQKGRLKADSIIDCEPTKEAIWLALDRLFSLPFQTKLSDLRNPYGSGGASERIVEVLRHHSLENVLKKKFNDIIVKPSRNDVI